jgi:superfamily I DNA/RNA helicase
MKNLTFTEWLKFDENLVFVTEAVATDPKAGHTLYVVQNKNTGKIYAARAFWPSGTTDVTFGEEINNFNKGKASFTLKAEEFKKEYQIMAEKGTPNNPIKFSSDYGKIFDAVNPIFSRFILPARFCRVELVPAITDKQKATDVVNIPVVDPTGYNPCKDKEEPSAPAAAGASAAAAKKPEKQEEKPVAKVPGQVHVNPLDEDCEKKLGDPEKSKIDKAFYDILKTGKRGNLVVNALAGSGKTSTLVCLWDKYGVNSGQRWLYLVFNKKNQVEAMQRFKSVVKRQFVYDGKVVEVNDDIIIKTTNSFLNETLKKQKGIVVPRTNYSMDATKKAQNYDNTGKPLKYTGKKRLEEKTKLDLAKDTIDFDNEIEETNLPKPSEVTSKISAAHLLKTGMAKAAIIFVKKQRKAVIKSAGDFASLCKQFGIDLSDKKKLEEKVNSIYDKYDVNLPLQFAWESWYSIPDSRGITSSALELWNQINGLIGNPSKEEINNIVKKLAIWLLSKTAPGVQDLNDAQLMSGRSMRHAAMGEDDQWVPFHKLRDFDDDYWYSGINMDKINWPKYDVVMADEVQDFNLVQKEMLKKLAEKGAIVMAVGDPNQAIYRFRGAEASSFNDVADTLKTDHEKIHGSSDIVQIMQTMPSNYRSRQEVIDYVNKNTKVNGLIRGLKYRDREDYHGEVTTTKTVANMVDEIANSFKDGKLDKTTAIIARTNEPLTTVGIELLNKGIPFAAIGKDFVSDIKREIESILDDLGLSGDTSINSILEDKTSDDGVPEPDEDFGGWIGNDALSRYYKDQSAKFGNIPSKQKHLQELRKNIDIIKNIFQSAIRANPDIYNVNGVFEWLNSIFKSATVKVENLTKEDEKRKVILTSVHKSKGFEFKRVYLIDIENFPSKLATREEDLEQEENAKYVAMTRAEEELHILDSDTEKKWGRGQD